MSKQGRRLVTWSSLSIGELDVLDAMIAGGSSTRLSAALILGRSLRNVTVVDNQKPCNRFSQASHGF
jgi:hypothetical protein